MTRHSFWWSLAVPFMLSGSVAGAPPVDPPIPYDNSELGPKCNRDRPEVDAVNDLVKKIESNKLNVKSVDAFIEKLPVTVRQSLLFMADSKSIQEASVKDPRVIMKSPNSEVTISFNSNAKQRGFDAVELQIWDADAKRFNMIELRFPQDSGDPHIVLGKNAAVERNPAKCATCHGGNGGDQTPRPVFDPYRQWAGLVPFSEDRLNQGSPEVDWYKSYLRRVEKGEPRFRHLKPMLTVAEIDEKLSKSPSIQVPSARAWTSQPHNTPGLDMSHQFTVLNGCRVAADLERRKDWDQIKYAAAGGLAGCRNITEFLNPEQNEAAAKWFNERGIGKKGKGFAFDQVVADTKKRQNRLSEAREANELWFLQKELGTQTAAEAVVALADQRNSRGRGKSGPNSKGYEIDDIMITSKSRFPTFENYFHEISTSRYVLEPLGIQTNLWSYAIDPDTYAHVEFFPEIYKRPEIQAVVDEADGSCERLAALSRDALKGRPAQPPIPLVKNEAFCAAPVFEMKSAEILKNPIDEIRKKAIQDGARAAFQNCMSCHEYGMVEGSPGIPFSDIGWLENTIRQRKNQAGDFGEIIWDRITRSPDSYNAMPLGMPMSNEDKLNVRLWLDSIR